MLASDLLAGIVFIVMGSALLLGVAASLLRAAEVPVRVAAVGISVSLIGLGSIALRGRQGLLGVAFVGLGLAATITSIRRLRATEFVNKAWSRLVSLTREPEMPESSEMGKPSTQDGP